MDPAVKEAIRDLLREGRTDEAQGLASSWASGLTGEKLAAYRAKAHEAWQKEGPGDRRDFLQVVSEALEGEWLLRGGPAPKPDHPPEPVKRAPEPPPPRQSAPPLPSVALDQTGVVLRSLDEAYRFAVAVVRSRLAPAGDSPESVLIKLQAGLELGFKPIQALQNLVVLDGKLQLKATGWLALIRRSGLLVWDEMSVEGEGDERRGVWKFLRRGWSQARATTFSIAEAKAAGLYQRRSSSGKPLPWALYEDDMLVWSAVRRGARRYFSDVLLGLDLAYDPEPGRASAEAERAAAPAAAAAEDPIFGLIEQASGDAQAQEE